MKTNYKNNKQELVQRAIKHRDSDTIVQGEYYDAITGKGCCGCLSETSDYPHEYLANFTNAPEWLFLLADDIHEGLSLVDSKKWVINFSEALATTPDNNKFWLDSENLFKIVCADECLRNKDYWLEHDKDEFYAQEVIDVLDLVKDYARKELSGEVVDWEIVTSSAQSAYSSALSGYSSVWSTSESAYRSAESAYWSSRSSTRFAAQSARFGAQSAWFAAQSAALSSARSTSESVYWSASQSTSFKRLSEELINILRREEEQK